LIVIGLNGYARSGKDTVADYMVEQYGFEKVSFAAPLKDMLLTLNPQVGVRWTWRGPKPVYLDDVYVEYGTEEAVKASKYGEEIRHLWQKLGTECVRKYDDMFWVRAAFTKLTSDDGRYVFTDVRFPNEADAINQLEGIEGYDAAIWEVHRTGIGPANGHASESHVGRLGAHYILNNTSTHYSLYADIDGVLKDMGIYAYIDLPEELQP